MTDGTNNFQAKRIKLSLLSCLNNKYTKTNNKRLFFAFHA